MAKTVCIVGAGPSGLVAAKTLLHDAPRGTFRVTILEAQPRIGGLWPSSKCDGVGMVHPLMLANQSKHTMQFSDLAWEAGAPELPRAWQVGRYLQRYWERYCGDAELCLSRKVERTERLDDDRWKVHVKVDGREVEAGVFDFLLVGSGYFGSPALPPGLPTDSAIPITHSSRYRSLRGLLGTNNTSNASGHNLLIVGGQFSGVEIAATIANQLSSAVHSPDASVVPNPATYSILHLIQRPPWVFPLFTSPKPHVGATPFLPLDLTSYNLANRPRDLTNTQGHISIDVARLTNFLYRDVIGTTQAEFGYAFDMSGRQRDEPPNLAVSDTYMDHVRSGLIKVSRGRLSSVSGSTATISPEEVDNVSPPEALITDLAAVVFATGFRAATSISFLPSSVQETLSVRPSDLDNTVALSLHGTLHPSLRTLGFVGFYRSPYWGVMEMQARLLTSMWTNLSFSTPATNSLRAAIEKDVSLSRTLALRTDPRRSQFPMGDYLYLMQEFAAALDMPRLGFPVSSTPILPHNGKPIDVLTPARYPPKIMSDAQRAENAEALRQTHEVVVAGLTGTRFVARAVFRSLLGSWELKRTIRSRLPSHPSGEFRGTAQFLLRDGTPDGRDKKADGDDEDLGLEYLYIEEGVFTADNGLHFPAHRRYVWRYDDALDSLSVWFVRPDDKMRVDYRFHVVEFQPPPPPPPPPPPGYAAAWPDGSAGAVRDGVFPVPVTTTQAQSEAGWFASASHLCEADYYDVRYEFCFRAVNLRSWQCGYVVRGPQKDYTLEGVYWRDDIPRQWGFM